MAGVARPAFPRISRRSEAPDLWLAMEGPRRTFAADAGDVSDLTGRYPAAIRADGPEWSGRVVTCNGSSGQTTASGFSFAGPPLTITIRFVATAKTPYAGLIFNRLGASFGLLLSGSPGAGSPLTSNWNDSGLEYDAATGLDITLGRPYFAAMVVTPTTLTTYLGDEVDGTLKSYTVPGTYGVKAFTSFVIGVDPYSSSRTWSGSWWDLRLYQRAFSFDGVAREFASPYRLFASNRRVDRYLSAPAPGVPLSGRTASTIRNTIASPSASDELIAAIQSGSAKLSGRTALAIRFAMANAVAADELIAAVNGSAVPLSGSTMSAIRFALAFSPAADELIAAVNAIRSH